VTAPAISVRIMALAEGQGWMRPLAGCTTRARSRGWDTVLGRGRRPAFGGQVVEERGNLRSAHRARMPPMMEANNLADPRAELRATEQHVPRGRPAARSSAGARLWARPLRRGRWVGLGAESRISGGKAAAVVPAQFRRCTAARFPASLRSYAATFFPAPWRRLDRIGFLGAITYLCSCGPLHVRRTSPRCHRSLSPVPGDL
jgi:hypothetical protein